MGPGQWDRMGPGQKNGTRDNPDGNLCGEKTPVQLSKSTDPQSSEFYPVSVKIPFNLGCPDVLACLKLLGVLLS